MAPLSEILHQSRSFFNTAICSVGRNKLRSFLSVLGVVFGVMAVMTIICIGQGAKEEALRQVEQLGTRNIYLKQVDLSKEQKSEAARRNVTGLNQRDTVLLQQADSSIFQIATLKQLTVEVLGALRQISPQVVACSANYADVLNLKILEGRFFNQSDIDSHELVCVLGNEVSLALGEEGMLLEKLRMGNQIFTIIGRLAEIDFSRNDSSAVSVRNHNEMILLPMGSDKWLPKQGASMAGKPQPESGFSEIIIETTDSSQVLNSASVINRIMNQSHKGISDYQMVVPLELLNQARKTHEMFNWFLGAIAGISLVVGGIGIMNIMLATISERKKEIGIRRAVGATKSHILVQFLIESVMLTLTGGIIGVILGAGMAILISFAAPWHASMSLAAVLIPLLMSVLVGMFFGLYPAYQAASVNPIQALRYE